jgi:hypothetical protein
VCAHLGIVICANGGEQTLVACVEVPLAAAAAAGACGDAVAGWLGAGAVLSIYTFVCVGARVCVWACVFSFVLLCLCVRAGVWWCAQSSCGGEQTLAACAAVPLAAAAAAGAGGWA